MKQLLNLLETIAESFDRIIEVLSIDQSFSKFSILSLESETKGWKKCSKGNSATSCITLKMMVIF